MPGVIGAITYAATPEISMHVDAAGRRCTVNLLRQPMWKINLAICITLVMLVAGYFFYQVQAASEQFRHNSREHSKVLAAAVELNIVNTMRSNEGLELVIEGFLANSARFVAYLDVIEHFTPAELTAFAREAGLAGISIIDSRGQRVEGPEQWGPRQDCTDVTRGLVHQRDEQLYSLAVSSESAAGAEGGCVIVGFGSGELDQVQADISVQKLLDRLSGLPGIASVELLGAATTAGAQEPARLVEKDGIRYSETRLHIGDQELVVTQVAGHFAKRLRQMRLEFFLFVGFLLVFGAISSWYLYYAERRRLDEARKYEQQMARQHEEAALGRAAATIAHEIRNPLNAIGMGLQRLQLEVDELDDEHRRLVGAMREAVSRSNTIITSLQQYVRDFSPQLQPVDLTELFESVLQLYMVACRNHNIAVTREMETNCGVRGDRGLLGQVFENIIKNAVEAQGGGGFCRVVVRREPTAVFAIITSGGFTLSAKESRHIFEPYFTTKTQGTGLGLAISRKIIESHGGRIFAKADTAAQSLAVTIELPLAGEEGPGLAEQKETPSS